MTSNEEKRQLLDKKLKEMSEDGVMKKPQVVTAFFDPPDDEDDIPITLEKPWVKEEEISRTADPQAPKPVEEQPPEAPESIKKTVELQEYKEEAPMTIEDYRSLYFQPTRIREKTAFTMNVETLEILRSVLQDLRERVSMASYLDNIVREHFRTHRELLNQATAKQRRKTTITI